MIKILIKQGTKGNSDKDFYEKVKIHIILTYGKEPLKSGTKQNKDAHSHIFYSVLYWQFLSVQNKKARKKLKGIQIGNSEVKYFPLQTL